MAAALTAPPTVAIAFDAAEPTLVRRLMAAGDMPVLADLAARGGWADVTSSTAVGSGSVWPTFATGTDVHEHSTHYVWRWNPARMRIEREDGATVVPWWRAAAESGQRVFTLDVPYLPLTLADGCTEVLEWGSHDRRLGTMHTWPERVGDEILRDVGAHPFGDDPPPPHHDPSPRELAVASARATAGAALRGELAARMIADLAPDLSLVVFSEMHHSSHLLWQTVAPDDPLFAHRRRPDPGDESLLKVFRAADAAVGRIVAAAPAGARVAVFSLHGMRSAGGIPTVLHPLLAHLGYAATPHPGRMSLRDAGRMAFGAAKRHAPQRARTAWRRSASMPLLNAVAGPTAMRAYDWDRTRAFVLPHDQHGWVRINLAGREARGTVAAGHYAGLCEELADALLGARTGDGRPLVARVLRVADAGGGVAPRVLPDLVVHWDDAAYDDPVTIAGSDIVERPDARRLTGRHSFDGFAIADGVPLPGGAIAGHDLHRLLGGA